jgi:hypothetical protein
LKSSKAKAIGNEIQQELDKNSCCGNYGRMLEPNPKVEGLIPSSGTGRNTMAGKVHFISFERSVYEVDLIIWPNFLQVLL